MINYYLLTKPGIVLGNLVTYAAGFLLASRGMPFNAPLFFQTLLGLAFVMASACVFNNWIDRKSDRLMERTKQRPLASGRIDGSRAVAFGAILGAVGFATLFFYTNDVAVLFAFLGFFDYVILYSLWKSRTVYGTAIGSIAGAVPPVVGYCAVSGSIDTAAIVLFALLVLWQMPHFFSIAVYHLDDYKRAHIPVLPIARGIFRTKVHMVFYIAAFTATALLLPLWGYTGVANLLLTVVLSLGWLGLCLWGFLSSDNTLWAKRMFRLSLLTIGAFCLTIF